MLSTVMYSSNKSDWGTPKALIQGLSSVFNFGLDAAANEHNYKCAKWLGENSPYQENGLKASWGDYLEFGQTVWLNPPYGKKKTQFWVDKVYSEYEKGINSVVLLPSRTETKWFETAYKATVIMFFHRRLRFEGATSSAPFPSCLVIFDNNFTEIKFNLLSKYGKVVKPLIDYKDFLD